MREPWQMTREEFIKQDLKRYREDAKAIGFTLNEKFQEKLSGEQHEKIVRKALSTGKIVPSGVLKEYPDLARPVGGEQAGMKEPWQMTQREWIDGHIKSPAMHKEHVRIALSKGKLVSAEVLKEYPDLAKPVGGEQGGMLGVPGKYVEQKRPWTPGQMGFESYAKYVEAMDRKYSLEELKELCRKRGISASGDKKTLVRRLF